MNLRVRVADTPYRNSTLYFPGDGEPHPGIVFLHGSEGGGSPFWKLTAQLFAAHGYACLAYCYFGRNDSLWGPRETLSNFELMELHEAMCWLKARVDGGQVFVAGGSRGAELAMLFGSKVCPRKDLLQPAALIAHCPADAVFGAWNLDWEDDRCWLERVPGEPLRGEIPGPGAVWNPRCGKDPRKLSESEMNAWTWQGERIPAGTRIEVEKIDCPVYISHGMEDAVWSVEMTRNIEAAMRKAGRKPIVDYFAGEDHILGREASERRMARVLELLRVWGAN